MSFYLVKRGEEWRMIGPTHEPVHEGEGNYLLLPSDAESAEDFNVIDGAVVFDQTKQDARLARESEEQAQKNARELILSRRAVRRQRRAVSEAIMLDLEYIIDEKDLTDSELDVELSDVRIQQGMGLLQANRPERFKQYINSINLSGLSLTSDDVAEISSRIDEELALRGL